MIDTRLDKWTISCAGSSYQIDWRTYMKACPKFMDYGATYLYIVFLTLGIPAPGFADMLSMKCSYQCYWGTNTIHDSFIAYLNSCTISYSGRSIMNPHRTSCSIFTWKNYVISGVNADTCTPRVIKLSIFCCEKSNTACTIMTSTVYYTIRAVSGYILALGNYHRVTHFWEEMKGIR